MSSKFPTEVIDLPSKGLLYSKDNPLSTGKVEMKLMTAREEDILTNTNYIEKGIVIDKLLQSMIVSKINYDDLLLGDKEVLMVAARILGYGKEYSFAAINPETKEEEIINFDLTQIQEKTLDPALVKEGKNEFDFEFPNGNKVTFKLLTQKDDKQIDEEIKGLKKIKKDSNPEPSTRLKKIITSVNGDSSLGAINSFVDNQLLIRDAKLFREHYNKINPGINLKINHEFENGTQESINIIINSGFFWPDLTT